VEQIIRHRAVCFENGPGPPAALVTRGEWRPRVEALNEMHASGSGFSLAKKWAAIRYSVVCYKKLGKLEKTGLAKCSE
jgi:hypothetical protein